MCAPRPCSAGSASCRRCAEDSSRAWCDGAAGGMPPRLWDPSDRLGSPARSGASCTCSIWRVSRAPRRCLVRSGGVSVSCPGVGRCTPSPERAVRVCGVRGAPDRETRVSLSSAPIPDACFDRKSYRVTCTIYLNTDSTDADNAPHILAVLASLCSRPGAAGRGNHGMRASWAAQVRGRTRRVPSCGFSHSRWHWSRWQSSRAPRCWRAE